LHVDLLAGHHRIADGETLRREDVCQLAVRVLDEGDEGRAVRIVLKPFDRPRDIELAPAEIDLAVRLLVAAADVPRRDPAVVVTAAGLRLTLDQHLDRTALPELA